MVRTQKKKVATRELKVAAQAIEVSEASGTDLNVFCNIAENRNCLMDKICPHFSYDGLERLITFHEDD